ncbi:MAG: TonB-dependent receptor plug domain-containing protein [Bacteroidota bacterium]|nr:TonB-dependent receptor plug domain-containing protein [Bacteroidota bacterium]
MNLISTAMLFTRWVIKGIICLAGLLPLLVRGQTTDTIKEKTLQEVVVKAYEQNKRLKDIPAAVNYVGPGALQRFNPSSIVQALNSTPGIRMEERSPGSFRMNIRGSSLRSPFGVRNVKVYFNDIPITDPGGITYLNQLGYYNIHSVEIIKGPGSSLYGAGTGGVLLIESMKEGESAGLESENTLGSYGLQNIYAAATTTSEKITSRLGFLHQQSDGYRNHSAMQRNVFSWNGQYKLGENKQLKTTFLYGNLSYETPGALTQAEYDVNPKAARPGSGSFPGSEGAQTAVMQKQVIAGASYTQQLTRALQNKTVFYGMFTDFRNPAIQNYGHNTEPHFGGRTVFKLSDSLSHSAINIDFGAELQQGFTNVSIYKNNGGTADSLRTFDEIINRQALVFTQAAWDNKDWTITASASLNFLQVNFERFSPASSGKQRRIFNNQVAPRFAILKKFGQLNIYTSVARGFSPPSTAELIPTGGAANLDLNAEQGTNYDIGIKGTIAHRLTVDINAFIFSLDNAIVQRRTAGGGDYYINSGKTNQHGIETSINYPLFQFAPFIQRSNFWLSHTWHDFHYKSFKQLNNDFSGNRMPAAAPHTISTGFEFLTRNGILGNVNYYFSDKIPLNDANSAYANAYHLVGLKLGYQAMFGQKARIKIAAGADNLFNQKYSLGNDANGFGGRYFNAAAGRNYYVSLAMQFGPGPTFH